MCLGQVPPDPAMRPFGEFMLGNRGEEPGGRPALPVRLFSEAGPEGLDRWQAQLVEHDAEARLVDGVGYRLHACPSAISKEPINTS